MDNNINPQDNPELAKARKVYMEVQKRYPMTFGAYTLPEPFELEAMEEYAAPLQFRIAELENDLNESNDMYDKDIKLLRGKISELEALNDKYKEALEKISKHQYFSITYSDLVLIADEALNSKI